MGDNTVMAETESRSETEAEPTAETDNQEDKTPQKNSKSSYKQKYKHAWELDIELRDWLTACNSDPYAAYCRFCRTKLHAHKKGLLAHGKSAKHKKHVENPNLSAQDALGLVPMDSFMGDLQMNGDVDMTHDDDDTDSRGGKRNHKGIRLFNDSWLKDPAFSTWLRKVPNNNTKALCIACRCVISAGRCELTKHTRAAKHKKAITEGPFEEVGDIDLHWLEVSSNYDQNFTLGNSVSLYSHQQASFRQSIIDVPGMLVDEIIERLSKHVPLEFAEKWDNVGIITKPTQPVRAHSVLLTIDLNEKIVEEAIRKRSHFIISYHPPIFSSIKSLNPKNWKDKAILMCIEHRITVYSPHTALDAVKGGINDWLISSFSTGEDSKVKPIHNSTSSKDTCCLETLLSEPQDVIAQAFTGFNVTMTGYESSSTDVRITCGDKGLPQAVDTLAESNFNQVFSRIVRLVDAPIPSVGMGRIVTLGSPLFLYEVVQKTKTHLDLTYIRLALAPKHSRETKVNTIAACAGSGYSVLKGCVADVWLTGEMSHHEVLDTVNNGITVILCEHSNTERGFLRDWSQQLKTAIFEDQVIVTISELDKDPLRIV